MVSSSLFEAKGLGFFGFIFPAFRSNLSLRGTKQSLIEYLLAQ